jgi:hypothetical protein
VSYHTRYLLDLGLIDLIETQPRRGAVEHYYRARPLPQRVIGDETWASAKDTVIAQVCVSSNTSRRLSASVRERRGPSIQETRRFSSGAFTARRSCAVWTPSAIHRRRQSGSRCAGDVCYDSL